MLTEGMKIATDPEISADLNKRLRENGYDPELLAGILNICKTLGDALKDVYSKVESDNEKMLELLRPIAEIGYELGRNLPEGVEVSCKLTAKYFQQVAAFYDSKTRGTWKESPYIEEDEDGNVVN